MFGCNPTKPRLRGRLAPVAAAIALGAANACLAQQPAAPANANATADTAAVELLSNGDSPRRLLRYTPEVGRTERMKMVIQSKMSQSMNGQTMGSREMPATTIVMEATPTQINDNGDVHYSMTIKDATADGNMGPQTQQALAPLVGISGKGVMSTRGRNRSMRFDAPPTLPPTARQQLGTMEQTAAELSMPFPEEKVGPGAEWKITTTPSMNGLTISQTMHVKLVSVAEDGTLTLDVTQTQSAEAQKLEPPQPGMELEVVSLTGSGDFDMKLSPDMLNPASSSGTSAMTVRMKVSSPQMPGGANMTQQTQSTTTVSTTPVSDDG